MKVKEFLQLYQTDSLVQAMQHTITESGLKRIHIKGFTGSADAVFVAALLDSTKTTQVFVATDREEAHYLASDFTALLGAENMLYFPSTYKKPYEFEAIENAAILQRAETLTQLSGAKESKQAFVIVTYPEALAEKVINKKALAQNTYQLKVGASFDMGFLTEMLSEFGFEKTEFVVEAGQYSVRGGILDVFSFAADYPYRLEFFGDELESIRTFHPENQLSIENRKVVSIVPNIQSQMQEEERVSFAEFLPPNTLYWIQNAQQLSEAINHSFERAETIFKEISADGKIAIVHQPASLYESDKTFKKSIEQLIKIELSPKAYWKPEHSFEWKTSPQTTFNKDFNLLARTLADLKTKGYMASICSENPKQLERLSTIFNEIDAEVQFQPLYISLRKGFEDHNIKISLYTDHQIFERFHRYKVKEKFSKSKSLTLRELKQLQPGDYVTHIDHGIARFVGLQQVDINGKKQEAIRLVFKDDDLMTLSVHALHKISKYSGQDGITPHLSKLGSGEWETRKKKVSKKVKDIARDLIALYAKRKAAPGFAFTPDSYLQAELESSFLYEDTPDQAKATADTKKDMEKPWPMDRLVCGDVGFGKTEIAIRAAFKAATDSKQVAVLVPTTILAMQHYKTFRERLSRFPVKIDYINRFKSTKEINETLKKVKEGQIDILIGTHRIVSSDIKFKNLGLMIIDEEQKFGVKVKDKLKELKANVDALTLTATPIPRTLQFSLMGARDLSIISTPPPNRQPVTTQLHIFDEAFIRDAVDYELRRGGQVFFVHNRISDIEEIAGTILRLVPEARIGIAHGQMEGDKLEQVMLKFMEGDFDVLVSTNIIESGLDIPNANTIIINRAHMFGLSDLHQMRGRVGRSNKKAFAYLLSSPLHLLTNEARKRLKTLEEFTELGDGFKVAMRDLDIRGAGNLLGAEQSGFVNDLGFEAYHKILDETISELKETEFKELFQSELDLRPLVRDCVIETDLELLIPEKYISSISERLALYNQLDNLKNEAQLQAFETELNDRFGPIPNSVLELTKTVRMRWYGENLGMEKISIKEKKLRAWFLSGEKESFFTGAVFGKVVDFVQKHPNKCRLKDNKGKLILHIEEVKSIEEATAILKDMWGEALPADAPNMSDVLMS